MLNTADVEPPILRLAAVLLASTALIATTADAQLLPSTPAGEAGPQGKAVTGRFRVGAVIKASRGACRDVQAMVAVPLECDEQTVKIVDEEFSGDVARVSYRDVPGGEARQMLIRIPYLPAKAQARAVVTFETTTNVILPPDDATTSSLKIPRRAPKHLRRFVSVSPFIEAKDRRIRKIARQQFADAPEGATDWQRVERLYNYVQDTIEYAEGPDTSAVQTLRDARADCHGRSALFIALCRAVGVPARVVWVDRHVYAEFYLEDADGQGAWYPAESAGSRAFGEMPLARVILQKGDHFRVPERPKDRLRYATDFVYVPPGKGKPSVKFIREQL
ncbi:MAG: transglutaminase-like domain-containing protein [Planctomycetota bacterium]